MKNTLLVNLFGGPGTGKSSMMASIFSALKWKGVDCEMAPEYAKEVVWIDTPTNGEKARSPMKLDDQIYIFGKQQHRIKRLYGKVDVIITDCPILLSIMYGKNQVSTFNPLVLDIHNSFNNLNICLERTKLYNPNGRLQTEDKARELDKEIRNILLSYGIDYLDVVAESNSISEVVDLIMHAKSVNN